MRKNSVKASLGLLLIGAAGTVIGAALRLPYQFGGVGESGRVLDDLGTKGTAVSPPLIALAILAVVIAPAAQRGMLGRIGSAMLALLALVFFIPTLGELTGSSAFSGPSQIVVIVWSLVGLALIVAMFYFGVREAFRRT